MGLINDEPDSGSEACVTTLDDGAEEGNIEVEEQNPEAIIISPIQPKPEVRVWVLCIRQQCFMLPGTFTATKTEILQIQFNYPYVRTLHFTVHYPDQPLQNIYINNKFLYYNLTNFVTFAIRDKAT